jgi:hypothetical protein
MYCFTVLSTDVNFGTNTVALKILCLLCITHKITRFSQVYLRKRFPKIIPFPRSVVFRFKVLFYMGNNSVPKFIFRLSRFPVYNGVRFSQVLLY